MKLTITTGDDIADEILKQRTGEPLGYKKWVAVDDEIKWLKKYLVDLKEQTETDGEDLPNWCIYKDIEKRIKQLNGDINK